MTTDKPLSQIESKLVVRWLRDEKELPVTDSYIFWRKRPEIVAYYIRTEMGVGVTTDDIEKAAGRKE